MIDAELLDAYDSGTFHVASTPHEIAKALGVSLTEGREIRRRLHELVEREMQESVRQESECERQAACDAKIGRLLRKEIQHRRRADWHAGRAAACVVKREKLIAKLFALGRAS